MKSVQRLPYDSDSGRDTDTDSEPDELLQPQTQVARVLCPLPAELLNLILDTLHRKDLTTCVRVNSAFCSISLPLLHHRILLSENGPWPLFEDGLIPGPLSQDRPQCLQRRPLASAPRILDIHPHKTTKCHCQHPSLPPLPRLDVLRLYLARTWSGARVFHTNVDLRDAYRHPEMSCAALHYLHPPTLVVRGLTLARSAVPPGEMPLELSDNVRHFVAVFEPDEQYFLPRNALATAMRMASNFRSCLPTRCDRLTLIFKPQGRKSWRLGTHTLGWRLIHSYATALWAQIAVWISKRMDTTLTIVNCGALAMTDGPTAPGREEQERMQDEVEGFMSRAVRERVGDDAEQVLTGVRCISMGEYLATDEWKQVFDVEEAAECLRGLHDLGEG